jgi:hypothetical protein
MVEGVPRDDEDQTGLWAGFCLPLGFTPLRQRVSGQGWSPPPTISERRRVSVAKRRDCIIKPLLALASSRDDGRRLDERHPSQRTADLGACGPAQRV